MARIGSVIFGLFALVLATSVQAGQTVLLVSIDGFRADYLDRGITPTLSALAAGGVRAAMRPSFPSLTFPNHYTLVTGLYPDHHGIVDNTMNDPALAHPHFALSDREAITDRAWWDEATPLWVSVQRQGGHAATMFWPGSICRSPSVRPFSPSISTRSIRPVITRAPTATPSTKPCAMSTAISRNWCGA